ncbi:hypothetical protein [Streptomyces sp. NEAU-NA10]|uniref:hypothetical protein n=1 Tax=Streptomyces sp. NEAU-NA10 TaxID=3416050 RepID=UPI003CC5B2EB
MTGFRRSPAGRRLPAQAVHQLQQLRVSSGYARYTAVTSARVPSRLLVGVS